MKKHPIITCALLVSLFAAFQVFGEEPTANENKQESGPPETVIRKLAAMMPEQTLKREPTTVSDGKVAPKGTVIYPVQLFNPDGSVLMKTFFFQEPDGWAVFDEYGQVFRPSK
jgi:hypothetical protein